MKVVGIVAEYNPFHKGHLHHIEEAKRITGADKVIAVLSGDFMQRGIPALADKYLRTQMALKNGVDLCIELPFCYSTASAEFFASASIAILDKLGVVDCICFGSECGEVEMLERIADILVDEPDEFSNILRSSLKRGHSFPVARSEALSHYFEDTPEYRNALASPNNILGIEYLKALKRRDSRMKPFTIKRLGSDYHARQFAADFSYSSAISIRSSLAETDTLALIQNQVPDSVYALMEQQFHLTFPIFRDDFSELLHYKLLLQKDRIFSCYADVGDSLSDRIARRLDTYTTYSAFCDDLKTKETTHARVSRALLHVLMDSEELPTEYYVNHDFTDYARILGFREDAIELLSAIKKSTSLTLLSKPADARRLLSPFGLSLFEETVKASHIYQSVLTTKYHHSTQNEYTRQIIKE